MTDAAETRGEPGGDPACWEHMLCPECGAMPDEAGADSCPRCGAPLGADEPGR